MTNSVGSVRNSLEYVMRRLRQANPNVRIVFTGSPDMGSVPRLPQPLRWWAGKRTVKLNRAIAELAASHKAIFAPIAAETGPIFRKHPRTLFAADNFHPTTAGYELWTPILTKALEQALKTS